MLPHLALECKTREEVHWKLVKASDLLTFFSAPCAYTIKVQPCYPKENGIHHEY